MAKRQQRSLFSNTKLYSDTQSSTFPPELHDGPRLLVQIANGLRRSSQQKQTTQDFFILAVKFDSVLMCLCVCYKKLNFLSWAIRPVFADPITYVHVCGLCSFNNKSNWARFAMLLKLQQFKLKICRVRRFTIITNIIRGRVWEGLLMEWGPSTQFLRFLSYTVSQIYSILGA